MSLQCLVRVPEVLFGVKNINLYVPVLISMCAVYCTGTHQSTGIAIATGIYRYSYSYIALSKQVNVK